MDTDSGDDSSYSSFRQIVWLSIGSVCVVLITLIFVVMWAFPATLRPPSRLLLYRFVCEFVFAVSFVISAGIEESAKDHIAFYCVVAAAEAGMIAWTLCAYADVIVIGRNPFQPHSWDRMFHLFCWGLCLIIPLVMVIGYRIHRNDGESNQDAMDKAPRPPPGCQPGRRCRTGSRCRWR